MIRKKMICYVLQAALALSLCACAGSGEPINDSETGSVTEFVEVLDPFAGKNEAESKSESEGTASEEDDPYKYILELDHPIFTEDYVDFMKHDDASTGMKNIQVKTGGETFRDEAVTYRGGEVEISFTMTPWTYAADHAAGYLVFIDGTPQLLSVDGSEPSAMAVIEGKNDEPQECTIRFTPRLAGESLAKDGDLALIIIVITNPFYKPFGTVAHFSLKHRLNSSFVQIPFRLEGDCEAAELVSGKAFEHFKGKDPELRKYFASKDPMRLSQFENGGGGFYFELCSETGAKPVIRDGKADITLLLYGGKPTGPVSYKVYVYVNHKPVKIDGCDYLTAEWKEGLVAKYSTTLDDLKEDDIVYAIIFAEDPEECSRYERVEKTDSFRLHAAE